MTLKLHFAVSVLGRYKTYGVRMETVAMMETVASMNHSVSVSHPPLNQWR